MKMFFLSLVINYKVYGTSAKQYHFDFVSYFPSALRLCLVYECVKVCVCECARSVCLCLCFCLFVFECVCKYVVVYLPMFVFVEIFIKKL